MPSSFTTSLRLELQQTGENRAIWGQKANNDFELIETAIAGVISVDMNNADYVLTTQDGATDEARNAVIILTGTNTAKRTLTIPAVSKIYWIYNQTGQTVGVSNGFNSVDLENAACRLFFTDGNEIFISHDIFRSMGTVAGQNTGTSGHTIPFLDGANTWSANQIVQGTVTATTFSGSLNASQLSTGTIPNARLTGNYTALGSLTGTGTASFASFSGSGAGLTNLNASNVSSGTLSLNRLPFTVDANTSGNTVVQRNVSGDINARLFRSEYDSTNAAVNFIMTQIDTASNNYIRPSTPEQVASALGPFVGFPAGTRMLFYQPSAPTGWVAETASSFNNKAVRIVTSGAGNGGGSNPFTTAFNTSMTVSGNVTPTALSVSHLPPHNHGGSTGSAGSHTHSGSTNTTGSHTHGVGTGTNFSPQGQSGSGSSQFAGNSTQRTSSSAGSHSHTLSINAVGNHAHSIPTQGSGAAHDHGWSGSVNLNVQYLDFLVCRKT